MVKSASKGIVLFIVLSMILIVVVLANVILTFILSQSRLTRHQTGRIQAYYAGQAGMNYALEQLRTGIWTYSPSNSCPSPNGCICSDSDFPTSIENQQVRIIFCPSGSSCIGFSSCNPPSGNDFCIYTTAIYTYTEP